MGKTLIEMVSEIVLSQATQKLMTPEEIDALIRKTYKSMKSIQAIETQSAGIGVEELEEKLPAESLPAPPEPTATEEPAPVKRGRPPKQAPEEPQEELPAVSFDNPMDSIQQDKIVCMECGEEFKQISHTHLSNKHNITPKQYRKKHGLPAKQPLTAIAISEKRKERAAKTGLGEKLKRSRQPKAIEPPKTKSKKGSSASEE